MTARSLPTPDYPLPSGWRFTDKTSTNKRMPRYEHECGRCYVSGWLSGYDGEPPEWTLAVDDSPHRIFPYYTPEAALAAGDEWVKNRAQATKRKLIAKRARKT